MNFKKAAIFGIFSAVIGAVVFTVIDLVAGRGFSWKNAGIAGFVFGILEFSYVLVE